MKICKHSNSIDQDGNCTNNCQQSWCTGSCRADCPVSYLRIKLFLKKINKPRKFQMALQIFKDHFYGLPKVLLPTLMTLLHNKQETDGALSI